MTFTASDVSHTAKPLTRRQAWRWIILNLKENHVIRTGLCRQVNDLQRYNRITLRVMWAMQSDIHTLDTKRKESSPHFWPLDERGDRMRIKAIEKLLSKK